MITQIKCIREEYLKFDVKGFSKSSILIIYDDILFDDNNDNTKDNTLIKVNMIDFDFFKNYQALKDESKDNELFKKLKLQNFLDPLNKILEILEHIKTE